MCKLSDCFPIICVISVQAMYIHRIWIASGCLICCIQNILIAFDISLAGVRLCLLLSKAKTVVWFGWLSFSILWSKTGACAATNFQFIDNFARWFWAVGYVSIASDLNIGIFGHVCPYSIYRVYGWDECTLWQSLINLNGGTDHLVDVNSVLSISNDCVDHSNQIRWQFQLEQFIYIIIYTSPSCQMKSNAFYDIKLG